MATVRCDTCGLSMQVPVGGRRQCACGAWLSGDEAPVAIPVVEAVEDDLGEVRYMLEDRAFGVELCHYADVFAIAGDLAMVGRREERLREKLKTMADREGRD